MACSSAKSAVDLAWRQYCDLYAEFEWLAIWFRGDRRRLRMARLTDAAAADTCDLVQQFGVPNATHDYGYGASDAWTVLDRLRRDEGLPGSQADDQAAFARTLAVCRERYQRLQAVIDQLAWCDWVHMHFASVLAEYDSGVQDVTNAGRTFSVAPAWLGTTLDVLTGPKPGYSRWTHRVVDDTGPTEVAVADPRDAPPPGEVCVYLAKDAACAHRYRALLQASV
jgi:hypothetical protein